MFGRNWEPGEATIITSETGNNFRPHSDWGTVSARVYVVDVRPAAGGPLFRSKVTQTYGEAEGAPGQKYRALQDGEIVRVQLDPKSQKVKFDDSDPRRLKSRSDAPSAFDAAAAAPPGTPPATRATAPGSASDALLATKTSALQSLLGEHNIRLGSQPEDVRKAVVMDLQAAGVPIDPDSLAIAPTDPAQMDAMLEVYKQHGLLPLDASIG